MGLEVASKLSAREEWHIHILDLNDKAGEHVVKSLPNSRFHKTNVASYESLALTFKSIFQAEGGRIDFVFANAGVIEKRDFYAKLDLDGAEPPPEPDQLSVDVDLKGVISSSYLAMHYFRRSPHKGKGANLIMTSSCAGLYPSPYSPAYSSAKRACQGPFLRSTTS